MLLRTTRRDAGFTLGELVAGIVVTAIVALGCIQFFGAIAQSTVRPVITYTDGNNYTLAPVISNVQDGVSRTDLLSAVSLQSQFSKQVAAADFVAVFGGTNVDAAAPLPPGSTGVGLPGQPLLMTAFMSANGSTTPIVLPSLASVSPASLTTTQNLATAAAADLVGANGYDSAGGSMGFTVLVFQGLNQLFAVAQVRQYTTAYTYNGSTTADLYATTLASWVPTSSASPLVGQWVVSNYYYWIPSGEDAWAVNVGAKHYWYRYETTWWGRQEPTGSSVIFPDPYVLSTNDGVGNALVSPVSRFSYFLSSSPQ